MTQKKFNAAPLAARMRPQNLAEFFGQDHLLGPKSALVQLLAAKSLQSMILWGPPGTGKTTLAYLIAQHNGAHVEVISAVLAGVKEVRAVIDAAKIRQTELQQASVLFVDEVHRFNKSQQDAFLPAVENGTITLIGATTENPSFSLNNALLSRARVYVLKALSGDAIMQLLKRALTDEEKGLGALTLKISDELLEKIASSAGGDARRALGYLEMSADLAEEGEITSAAIEQVLSEPHVVFDRQGDEFYDQISALHKSVRGSDPDASLYWLARMLVGGCDPLYIARRVVRMASEDIGNADPRALQLALAAWEVVERLGQPEGELVLAQAVIYMAVAAKSNAVYMAYNAACKDAQTYGTAPVPLHLRNAPTKLMKSLDYGKNYRYAHDEAGAYAAGERYFPENMPKKCYYEPAPRGLEIKIAEKLAMLKQLNKGV
ncbi:MAG TPA: replication-associated recombination protein A [Gammaproteobacteria bacterium]|nr:replication-associated recombination protein A [Gammaproteobacteria bacterium]